jgi:hypothetical protein
MYHQELAANENRAPPLIRAKIGDSLIDLTTLNLQKDLIEKSFDLEPWQLQSAIETGSLEITEMFGQSMIKKPSVVVKFSTLGLSTNLAILESNRINPISDGTIDPIVIGSLLRTPDQRE